jgi:hypothetical protein
VERRCDFLKRLTFSLLSAAQNHVGRKVTLVGDLCRTFCAQENNRSLRLDDADRNLRRSRINLQREKL